MPINWWTVGSLYGAASVAFGAFGAHGLKSRGISDAKIASWGTAAHYQVGEKPRASIRNEIFIDSKNEEITFSEKPR